MRIFINKNQNNHFKQFNEPCSNSTFLIPKIHMQLFQNRLERHDKNLTNYLSYLLNRYRLLIRNGFIPKHKFLKTAYQEKNQDLQRIDFIPNPKDWAELKSLRIFFNRSMTWIFVFLLLLDSLDLDKNLPNDLANFVVPKISNVRLDVSPKPASQATK